jgi:hypothetical protein
MIRESGRAEAVSRRRRRKGERSRDGAALLVGVGPYETIPVIARQLLAPRYLRAATRSNGAAKISPLALSKAGSGP